MPLATGQLLSFYEILGPLGAGAMGEVYRAQDTRLEREVAIKVLPQHFADNEERLQRFEREAKSLAALNHSNVAQIFGVDQAEGIWFLVLELVPGETLEERIARGALPVAEAIDVCAQIAEGLEAAHEAGVIHRDVKPANVRITADGRVKVLDFGLAKPTDPEAEHGSSTDSVLTTEEGRLLGTPTYMAPEQARGKPIDRRVDVWALGCVLYECLTAKRAFAGETISDVIASVLQDEPDWARLPTDLPAHARDVLERCLEKDPRERLRDVGDARLLLARPLGRANETQPGAPALGLKWFVAGTLLVGALWLGERLTSAPASVVDERAYQFALELAPQASDSWISPDGTRFVYWQDRALYLRRLDEDRSRLIPGTEGAWESSIGWSPDGQSIVFGRNGFLETLELGEARSVRRCRVSARPSFVSWSSQDALLFEIHATPDSDGLYLHRAGAAETEALDWIDVAQQVAPDLSWPNFLPDGERFLITLSTEGEAWIHVASLKTRSTRRLIRAQTRADYVEPGWLAWVDAGRLLVQPFDAETAKLSGAPHELVEGVSVFLSTGLAHYRFSDEGTLAYWPVQPATELEWIARDGRHLGPAAMPRPYQMVRLDPSGTRLAASMPDPTSGSNDLWIIDLGRDTARRLTHHERWEGEPAWSADGTRIAFQADWHGPPNLYEQEVEGREARELVPYDGTVHGHVGWAPGGMLVYNRETDDDTNDLWVVDTQTLERRALLVTPFNELSPTLPLNGRWLAYSSNETGRNEVYVTSFPELRWTQRISTRGGALPRWKADGSELFYVTASGDVVAVALEEQSDGLLPGDEEVVVQAAEGLIEFDVAPDGERLLVLRERAAAVRRKWKLITSWERLLDR